MRVFLTGATGFIGSRIVPELLAAGHSVLGMTRSEEGAAALRAAGVEPHLATLEDPAGVARGAAAADGVIHTAFDHDFAHFVANCEKDAAVIAAIGAALAGSDRPFVLTSGTGIGLPEDGGPAIETVFNPRHPNPRIASEMAGQKVAETGVNVSVVRLPQVHDTEKQGLITPYVALTREKGVAAYIGDGAARWPAAHVSDVARLYVRALERAEPGARYHAVAEEGIAVKAIAETIARGLGIDAKSLTADEAPAHFGWLAGFAGLDMPASSAQTRAWLDWEPTGPGLISDLERMRYDPV